MSLWSRSALAEEGVTYNEGIYTPLVTLCVFLSQVLDPDHSCRAAVARLIVWLAINRRKPVRRRPPATARHHSDSRWGSSLVWSIRPAGRSTAGSPEAWLWKGRRVALVDGTTASTPDTAANQEAFPQSKAQGVGLGFPVVRMVAMISLATGVVRNLALAYVWGGRDLRAVAPRSDSANFPGFFSILCSVFRDSVVTIFRVIS